MVERLSMPLYNNHRYGRMEKSSINVLGMAMAILLVATTMTVFAGNQAYASHNKLYLHHGDSWYYKGNSNDAPEVHCGFGQVEEGGTC